ncbi:MAG: hypothetical protein NVS3B1_19670 [Marmoricola sp.]
MKDVFDSFERLEAKFDHFHKPKGPGGGQFTSAPNGSAGPGYGEVARQAIRRGDHPDHPMPAGDYPEGDPRNDPEYKKYLDGVDKKIAEAIARGEESHKRFGVFAGHNEKGEEVWLPTKEREIEYKHLIDQIMADHAHVPNDRQAIMLGGLPGAGKSTYLSNSGKELGGFLKVDKKGRPTNAIVINPDDMKSLLLTARDSRGNPLIPRTAGLTDGEHASLVHEESSRLAAMLAARAMAEGKNVVFDITLGNAESATRKYLTNEEKTGAKDLGYKVHAVFIDGDMKTSLHRAGMRHKNPDKKTGERTYSGRYVPYDVIAKEANKTHGIARDGTVAKSQNRLEYDKLVRENAFESAVRHDNATEEDFTDKPLTSPTTAAAQLARTARQVAAKKRGA